jgi:hypothetical protein
MAEEWRKETEIVEAPAPNSDFSTGISGISIIV